MKHLLYILVIISMLPMMMASGCRTNSGASSNASQQGNDLDSLETARISIAEHQFEVWLAQTHAQRVKGLMFVQEGQLQPLEDGTHRGMLFIFEREDELSFWMKDTFIQLDIAYAESDGTIVKTYTMTPLDTSQYPSGKPAQFALEVTGGLLEELGISAGARLIMPD